MFLLMMQLGYFIRKNYGVSYSIHNIDGSKSINILNDYLTKNKVEYILTLDKAFVGAIVEFNNWKKILEMKDTKLSEIKKGKNKYITIIRERDLLHDSLHELDIDKEAFNVFFIE